MLTKSTVQLMALGLVGSFAATAAAQDSGALIDALVRKGVLKDQEAEQIRTQLSRDFAANTPAGKLNLSSSVKELKLSGDVRARYTNQNDTTQAGVQTRDGRTRLRLRVNGDYKLNDEVTAGFGIQTQSKSDSGNVTLAKDTATGYGYYENYGAFISKAYLGWTPISGVTLTGGKFADPLYTTDMLWDADINPAGFAERIDFHKFLNLGGLELSLNALQGSVSDKTESVSRDVYGNRKSSDGWVSQTQIIVAADLLEGVKLTVAPGYYFSNGASAQSANAGGGEKNDFWANTELPLRGLKVLLLPGDVSFKVIGKPSKFVWDLAYNQDASDRMGAYVGSSATTGSESAAAALPTGTDKLAWLAGFQIGENKKKGDWSVLANWRQVGAAAVDSNINDSDWALSRTNMAGPKVSFVYNIGDAFTLGTTFLSGNNLRREISTGPADKSSVRVLQIDAVVKF